MLSLSLSLFYVTRAYGISTSRMNVMNDVGGVHAWNAARYARHAVELVDPCVSKLQVPVLPSF